MSRVALVTGGSRGIGRAVAGRLGAAGIAVAVNYASRQDAANQVVKAIEDAGGAAMAIRADVSESGAVAAMFQEVEAQLGKVDILVNNAGITRDNLLLRLGEDDWDQVIAVNLKSVYLCSKIAVRSMIRGRWGRIISVSSVVGLSGNPGQANYAASKAGIIGFSKSLAKEVGSRGVTVNVVAPGFIATDMTQDLGEEAMNAAGGSTSVGRLGTADEVSSAVEYLAGDHASYVTGHVLVVDGGLAL